MRSEALYLLEERKKEDLDLELIRFGPKLSGHAHKRQRAEVPSPGSIKKQSSGGGPPPPLGRDWAPARHRTGDFAGSGPAWTWRLEANPTQIAGL